MYDIYVNGEMYLNEVVNRVVAIHVAKSHPVSAVINNVTNEVIFSQGANDE